MTKFEDTLILLESAKKCFIDYLNGVEYEEDDWICLNTDYDLNVCWDDAEGTFFGYLYPVNELGCTEIENCIGRFSSDGSFRFNP